MKVRKFGVGYAVIRIWAKYVALITRATSGIEAHKKEDISYWREMLFTKFITYLLPTCLIALLPGVYMSIKGGFLFIATTDIIAVLSIAVVSINSYLSLSFRKVFVIAIMYLLSIVLLIDLSLLGPGIVYLLALSVLIAIIFPRVWGYWSVLANLLICIGCALVIHFKLFNSALYIDYELGAWIAVSSNLVFLSFVMVVLVSNTIKGFEKVIGDEQIAKKELLNELKKGADTNILLAQSESHFRTLFYQNPSPMWVLDDETLQFLEVNDSAISQYGYTNEEFLCMNVEDIKMEKDKETLHKDLTENKRTGVPKTIITEHRKKNQEQLFVEVTFNSIMFGTKSATLAISQDISEQIKYIKAIESQNEIFKEIAWIQSHNVRGPLATILGLTQLFNNKDIIVDTDEIITGILESSLKLDTVIKEIVDKTSIANFQITPTSEYGKILLPIIKRV